MWFKRRFGKKRAASSEARQASAVPDRGETEELFTEPPSEDTHAVSGCVISDVGRARENNEDNYLIDGRVNDDMADHSEAQAAFSQTGWRFTGVFDGMGGGDAGELAARGAAKTFRSSLSGVSPTASRSEVDLCVRGAFLEANNRIADLQKSRGYRLFGTTATILASDGKQFKIYHMGDSRAYLFREDRLLQITRDQTLARMKIDSGFYGPDDPAVNLDKHRLTEFLGRDASGETARPAESRWASLKSGDTLLLCSDGLYDMCGDREIAAVLGKALSTEEKCRALAAAANEHGGVDNITCLVLYAERSENAATADGPSVPRG